MQNSIGVGLYFGVWAGGRFLIMPFKDKQKQKESARKHYLLNKEKIKKRARLWTDERNARNKELVRQYLLVNPCVDCGEKDIVVLEFDHQRDKVMAIAEILSNGWREERLMAEINKCEVRCANCHRRKTAKQLGWIK